MSKISGIYKITCIPTGKFYIGSSVDIHQRWHLHISKLRNGTHHSPYFQNSWNKYGEESFLFEIIDIVHVNRLIENEQFYIDNLNPEFNVCPIAGSSLGARYSASPKTLEHKEKISNSLSQNWIITPPNGESFVIKNLKRFCEQNNLDKGNMLQVANGVKSKYKGWACSRYESSGV